MFESRSKPGLRLFRDRILGIVCLLLIALCATIQVVHTHGLTTDPHPDCALCLVAHAAVTASAHFVLPAPPEQITEVQVVRTESPRESFVFTFYCRPPPAEPASL